MVTSSIQDEVYFNFDSLIETGESDMLGTLVDEISQDSERIRISYQAWFADPESEFGEISAETAEIWMSLDAIPSWLKYGASGSHFYWREICTSKISVKDKELPEFVLDAWIDWMLSSLRCHKIVAYFDEEWGAKLMSSLMKSG